MRKYLMKMRKIARTISRGALVSSLFCFADCRYVEDQSRGRQEMSLIENQEREYRARGCTPWEQEEPVNDPEKKKQRRPIILDPGHGGIDTGTPLLSVSEDEIAYDISVRVRALLLNDGYEVHQTVYDRKTKYAPLDELQNGTSEYLLYGNEKKTKLTKRYLTQRCKLINAVYPQKDPMLVSIHVNYTWPEILGAIFFYPGAETYGSLESEGQSLDLAEALQRAFCERGVPKASEEYEGIAFDSLVPDIRNTLTRNGENFQLAIFDKTSIETKVLVETGNVRNENDAARLLNPRGRQDIADAIYYGIARYSRGHK